ncbi:hypothetical protein [Marinicella sp. W31]|uniref:hypothetical protein n=1 Tax=Marinicella sp. W31 TaxID=3023713 RepID=UPI0037565285
MQHITGTSFLSISCFFLTIGMASSQARENIYYNGFEIQLIMKSGFEAQTNVCNDTNDNDNDRLLNCYETNTGVFINNENTGTDPNNADTDGDAITDGDEVLGTLEGLNLPAMGTNPLVKNILLEYDWFDDSNECAAHSHRPTQAIINRVDLAFLNAPINNPDGSTGIVLIQDYGQGGAFQGGNLINDADGVLTGGVSGSEFLGHKATHFANNRNRYFHYVILPHRYNTDSGSSGQAEINGDDMIVSLYCFNSTRNVANTIVHELGHNLSFLHGGNTSCNYKPNYNSVMNYRYQFPGVDDNCTPPGDNILDYSSGLNISLNENNLDENAGICGTTPWDWNENTVIDGAPVSFDINSDGNNFCGGTLSVLEDYNDWGNINYNGIFNLDRSPDQIIDCQSIPSWARFK